MILAIDIGNSSTVFYTVTNIKKIKKIVSIISVDKNVHFKKKIDKALEEVKKEYSCIDKVYICSVVPKYSIVVEKSVRKEMNVKPTVIGRDIKVPIINRYTNPEQVGQDRLICAYAAMKLLGGPAIVVDLGTAITFDVISNKKEYLGGLIIPGIDLSAEVLYQKTALLPKVEIQKPASLIGKDTHGSILSGIFFGYGEMISGLISLLSKKVKGEPSVILTGGYTNLIKKYISMDVDKYDDKLLAKGVFLLDRKFNAPS